MQEWNQYEHVWYWNRNISGDNDRYHSADGGYVNNILFECYIPSYFIMLTHPDAFLYE